MSRRGDNIHKRKDGRWEGRYRVGKKENGQIIYKSIYAKTYSQCKAKLETYKSGHAADSSKTCFFSEAARLWSKNNEIKIKDSTEIKYEHMLKKHILPKFGEVRLDMINATMVNIFLSSKLKYGKSDSSGFSTSYVRTMAIIIESVLNFAASEGLCESLSNTIYKPAVKSHRPQVLSCDAQKIIEEEIAKEKTTAALGTIIAFYTGLRIGEICALKWGDIDLSENLLYVNHTISRVKSATNPSKTIQIISTPKTKSSKRVIPIASPLKNILQTIYCEDSENFVITNSNKFANTRTFDYQFKKLFEAHGLDAVGFHTIRHTFATRCIQSGMDVKTLSEILGHSSAAITLNTYVHSSIEVKRNQLERAYSAV